jgi:iron complex transport system substrate-binding protein
VNGTGKSRRQIFTHGASCFLVALLTTALALTACNPTQGTPTVKYVTDDLGREVAINGTPARIVSLAPSNTEILFALGLGDKVVGVTDYCDYPPEADNKTRVGGYINPDIEKIVALKPDLILVAYGTPMDVIDSMVGLGLTVFGIKTTDLDDLLNDIETVGKITDKETEADTLTSEMESEIQAVTSQTEGLEQRPRVFYIVGTGPLWTAGSDTFIDELIQKAGGVNICENITGYSEVSLEYVVACNPEVIITSSWPGVYEWAMNSTELAITDARESGRVYACDDNLVQRPGPRLVEGLKWFAYFINPEMFGEPEGS